MNPANRRITFATTPSQAIPYLVWVEVPLGCIENSLESVHALARHCRRKYRVSKLIFFFQYFNDLMWAAKT